MSDLLVEEAELLEANSQYAYIRLEDGREIPVSLQDLAPKVSHPGEKTTSTTMMWQQNLCCMSKPSFCKLDYIIVWSNFLFNFDIE